MSCFRILAFLIVIISFAECLPPGNITHIPRRVFKFPQNSSTAIRHLPPGRIVVLSPLFFPEYLVPRMVGPSTPRVVRPNIPQVVRSKFPQAVRSKFLQEVKSETPQAVKSDVKSKLSEKARTPGRARLLEIAQPDQLVSASSSSSFRTPSGGWARQNNTTSRIGTGEEPFVFPEDDVDDTPPPRPRPPVLVTRAKYKPNIKNQAPPCANGSTFCERIDGYPEDILENILDNELDQFKELQGTDELNSPPITQRIDANSTNEQSLCSSVEDIVFPRTAKTKDDKWRLVLNTASFTQGVRIEKCINNSNDKEQKCFFDDAFPIGYKTVCKQKFIYRRMVALDDSGKPVPDTFLLPSCCSCAVIAVGTTFRQGMLRKALRTTTVTPSKN